MFILIIKEKTLFQIWLSNQSNHHRHCRHHHLYLSFCHHHRHRLCCAFSHNPLNQHF